MTDRARISQPIRMEDGGLDPIKLRLNALEAGYISSQILCYNNSGSVINAGSVCRILANINDIPTIIKAQADSETNAKGMLIMAVNNILIGNTGNCMIHGEISDLSGLTPGAIEYLSSNVAGEINETPVSASGEILRIIGYAVSNSILFFNPDITYIEIA